MISEDGVLRIKFHSFVDLITNSSTVIYQIAHGNTINYVKEIIDGLLSLADSKYKADDLFTFEITSDDFEEYYNDYVSELDDEDEVMSKEEYRKGSDERYWSDELKVTPKTDDPTAKKVAEILTKRLDSLFHYEESYDG